MKLFEQIREFMILGQFKDALDSIESIDLQYLEEEQRTRIDAWSGMCIIRQGKYQQGLELVEKIIETHNSDPKSKEALLDAVVAKAFAQSALGQIEEGLDMCRHAEDMLKTLDLTTRENMARLATVLTLQGLNTFHKGDLETAIEIYLQSHPILEELGNRKSASAALHNVGSAYRVIGNLDQALEYVIESKRVSEEIHYIPNLAGAITTTGIIQYQRGHLEEAAENLDKSMKMFQEIGHKVYLARSLYYGVIIAIEQGLLKKAEWFLDQMKGIDEEVDSLLVDQHYRAAKALWLKARSDSDSLRDAQELFEQVVNEKITYFEVTFLSLLSLSDLLLDQLKSSGNEELMVKIKEHAEMALEIAISQGSYWLRAETYCLQAQISLIELEYENAKRLLTQAQLIADEKGLHQLARKISNEFDELLEKEEKWTELTMNQASMLERVEVAQIDERVERMARIQEAEAPIAAQDDPIQFMLMSAHGGFCIVSKEFQTSFKVDESLVTGFLSAITSFSDEVFSMPLDRIKVGDYIILFRAVVPFLFCYVFKGESYTALKKVDKIIEALQEDIDLWNSLENTVDSGLLNHETNHTIEQIVTEVFQFGVH